jgi:hypothetical protein
MGFKVPQHWGILGAKISIHDRAKYRSSKNPPKKGGSVEIKVLNLKALYLD